LKMLLAKGCNSHVTEVMELYTQYRWAIAFSQGFTERKANGTFL